MDELNINKNIAGDEPVSQTTANTDLPADPAEQHEQIEQQSEQQSEAQPEAQPEVQPEVQPEAQPEDNSEPAKEPAHVEKPLWSFSAQAAADREAAKRSGRRGALVYAVIMTALFAVCFSMLIALLVTGFGSEGNDRPPIEISSSGVADLVDNVIDGVVTVYVTADEGYGFGSGFVYTDDGYIITNYHVIDGAQKIYVLLYDGRELDAELIDGDELSDVAVIHVTGLNIPKLHVGDSDELRVGETVVAIGTPVNLEFAGTTTQGIISGLNRKVQLFNDAGLLEKTMYLIQTDTKLNHGNSGGPLFNMQGEVIGINTLKHMNLDTGDEMGFAIPINDVVSIADDIIEDGKYSGNKGSATQGVQLGITCGTVYKDEQIQLTDGTYITPGADGVMVNGFTENSVCKDVLELYDIILSIDGVPTPNINIMRSELYSHKVGDTVTLEVYRDGRIITVDITL
ncbi:MAG: trypsin-like peptidase domain-containing protein [Eubacteriales bacterium]